MLRHALGESERCVWSNCFPLVEKAPDVVHQRIEQDPGHSAVPGEDDRPFVEAANSCSTRTVRRRDGWRPIQTTSGPLLLDGRRPNSTFARHGSENRAIQHNARTLELKHRRGGNPLGLRATDRASSSRSSGLHQQGEHVSLDATTLAAWRVAKAYCVGRLKSNRFAQPSRLRYGGFLRVAAGRAMNRPSLPSALRSFSAPLLPKGLMMLL